MQVTGTKYEVVLTNGGYLVVVRSRDNFLSVGLPHFATRAEAETAARQREATK